jgi:hypothetical protein
MVIYVKATSLGVAKGFEVSRRILQNLQGFQRFRRFLLLKITKALKTFRKIKYWERGISFIF